MATILCVWELGTDLGHLSNLRLAIEVALKGGHKVVLAARELHRARDVLGDMPITYLQAPFKQFTVRGDQSNYLSYTHLIAQQCFSDSSELCMYLAAWRGLFELTRPAVVLFEHSPTALITAHDFSFAKVIVGNGFTVPTHGNSEGQPFVPFPTTPRTPQSYAQLVMDDTRLLACINHSLKSMGLTEIGSLATLYAQADARFLMTWPELDHLGPRVGSSYLGIEPPSPRATPLWPKGGGSKVFGYLHAIPSLELLLQALAVQPVCALLFVRYLPPELRARYTSDRLQFVDQPVDLSQVSEQAAWVINLGNHRTAATFALAGVPQLLIPLHQEHLFLTTRLVAQGAAAMAFQDQNGYTNAVDVMQNSPHLQAGAKQLGHQLTPYADLNAADFIGRTFASLI